MQNSIDLYEAMFWYAAGFGTCWALVAAWQRLWLRIDRKIGERLPQTPFFAEAKTATSETKENSLANENKSSNNTHAEEEKNATPLWNDRDRIKALKERIESNGFDQPITFDDEASLANMTPLEAWRKLDARYLELEIVDEQPQI